MAITDTQVKRIAHLARLAIHEQECRRYSEELSTILDLVADMDRIDTSGVEPLSNPLDQTQRLRVDEVTEVDQREHFQAVAPKIENGLYLVPKVIE